MKKILILCAAGASLFGGLSAHAAERSFSISSFEDVRVLGGVNVVIKTDESVSAKAEASSRALLDRVTVRKNGSQLIVSVKPKNDQRQNFSVDAPVTVYLSTDRISNVVHTGSGSVSIDGLNDRGASIRLGGFGTLAIDNVDSDELDIAMQGGGELTLSGKARKSSIKMLGSSMLNGAAFTTEDLELFHRGPASSRLAVKRDAVISNSGTGMIQIDGTPSCKVKSDGAAQIICDPES